MKLNLRRLLQERREQIQDKLVLQLAQEDFNGYTPVQPVVLEYQSVPIGGKIDFAFTITTEIETLCSRCMQPTVYPVQIEKQYYITAEDINQEFPELPISPDGNLDLREFAYQELVLEVPPVIICREDCEGLCGQCGAPAGSCTCAAQAEKQVDPRLQSLLKLLEE